jgi:hypothetical protein
MIAGLCAEQARPGTAWVGQLVGGGVSGAIVSAIVGLVTNNMKRA